MIADSICQATDRLLEYIASELERQVNVGLLPVSVLRVCHLLLVTDRTLAEYAESIKAHIAETWQKHTILDVVVRDLLQGKSYGGDTDVIVLLSLSYDNEEERPSVIYEIGTSFERMGDNGAGTVYLDC